MKKQTERSLAHIERVREIRPIEGADNIEQCYVLGWNLIVKKDEFKADDLCVYIEIDSKVPERPEFEFLRTKKFAVKTMKLSRFGVYSQGLALPVSMFKELKGKQEGEDVTKLLGITYSKAEDNVRKSNKVDYNASLVIAQTKHKKFYKNKLVKRLMRYEWFRKLTIFLFVKKTDKPEGFPTKFKFISKTDETRIENMPNMLKYKRPLVCTEKLDGCSATYIMERTSRNKFEFYVCSRNMRIKEGSSTAPSIYWDMAKKYEIRLALADMLIKEPKLKYACVQGECVGNVQGNPLKLKENDFYAYNLIFSDIGRIDSVKGKNILEKYNIKWVPILSTDFVCPDTMEEMKELATDKSVVNPAVMREGCVYRSEEDNAISFKNVSREYLLKHE